MNAPAHKQEPDYYDNSRWMIGEIVLAQQILGRRINTLKNANNARSAVSQKLAAEELSKIADQLKHCADIIARTSAEFINRRPR